MVLRSTLVKEQTIERISTVKMLKKDLFLRDRVINDILKSGLDFTVKIMEYYDNESEAFRVEGENIQLFSVTELLTNVAGNFVSHNWRKHKQQLNVPLKVFQTTTQPWPDEVYRLGATIQRWEDDETIVIKRRHEIQIKQDVLNDVTVNKKEIKLSENKSSMIAEYEKMIAEHQKIVAERKLHEIKPSLRHHDEEYDEHDDDEHDDDEHDDDDDEIDREEAYPEETECGYCGAVFSNAKKLKKHYENCSEKQMYVKPNNREKWPK